MVAQVLVPSHQVRTLRLFVVDSLRGRVRVRVSLSLMVQSLRVRVRLSLSVENNGWVKDVRRHGNTGIVVMERLTSQIQDMKKQRQ